MNDKQIELLLETLIYIQKDLHRLAERHGVSAQNEVIKNRTGYLWDEFNQLLKEEEDARADN